LSVNQPKTIELRYLGMYQGIGFTTDKAKLIIQ